MATFTKVNDFIEQLIRGVHDFDAHTFKVALTNTAPTTAATSWSTGSFPAPAAANGYTAGGYTTTISVSETSGTVTVQGTQITVTASGGSIGPFQYGILYNDTATSPADAIIGYFAYDNPVTLTDGQVSTIKFNNATPGTIFTAS